MPPQAKPSRLRYQLLSPTGWAAAFSKSTAPLSTALSPRLAQVPGTASTPSWRRSTVNARRSLSPTWAVTTAWSSREASEHQGLRPSRRQATSSLVAVRRAPGPSAANTPQVPLGAGIPACARMARASRCGSAVRATVRSAAAMVARVSQRRRVEPCPGNGDVSSPPTSPSANATEPAADSASW